MRKQVVMLLPLLMIGTLAGCNKKEVPSSKLSSSSSSKVTSVVPSSSHSSSTVVTPSSSLDLSVSFEDAVQGEVLEITSDWVINTIDTYNKAIKIKTEEDYVETPTFTVKGPLEVSFTAFKSCGTTADGKLVMKVEGIDRTNSVVETVTITEDKIPLGSDKAEIVKVTLNNAGDKIIKIKIGVETPGKATNVAIKDIKVKSL